ncbi:delta(24)-sterol reductase-like [Folsomia candida]|uniref:delta(24)-sterol reductase-like n=1 Tax=Folsomia candida TaxID=158441 RepID=UPI001604F8CE|nr:delta(24)-sterol reductase-like [Folsomia candida]XP_035716484.1 delta(24)-sterol reductase-like [Folsomia candida]XP_035716485.1 delta(24)-sterol reductase-like [Folsomia candida]XP_035716486.1 delta(24)-sterol reductase-like [Folsomia candida]XP_035716487.1 delta(24)-sterol reductase-like [Folsomia candida]
MAHPTFFERLVMHICRYYVSAVFIPLRSLVLPFLYFIEFICAKFKVTYSPELHANKVEHVQSQIMDWNKAGRRNKLCTARPGWVSMSLTRLPVYKDAMTGIDLSRLDDLVSIDKEAMTITVEPLMKMGQLTRILGSKGYTILVVPELKFLTVGGLICGAGLETSSHKYGFFHNTCTSYEVVLSSGEVVKCSKDENSDMFYAIPGSYGTLGFLTAATIKIMKAEKYVKLSYIPVNSLDEATKRVTEESLKTPGPDFVEGIMYSLDKGVIMVGTLTSKSEPGKVNPVSAGYKKSFYKHVQSFLTDNQSTNLPISQIAPNTEFIPLRDYYHRHSYATFWTCHTYVPYIDVPLFRYIFGWAQVEDNYAYKIIPRYFRRIFEINLVIQDLIVPIDKMKMALEFFHEEVKVPNEPVYFKFDGNADKMYMDIGLYGYSGKPDDYEVVKSNKALEQFCLENDCIKGAYADLWLSRNEHDQMFDPTLYNKVRAQLNCSDAFPDIYDKICQAGRK